jgi:hypothetical protein
MGPSAPVLIGIHRRQYDSFVDGVGQTVVPHFDNDAAVTDASDTTLDIPRESEGIRFTVEFTDNGRQNIKHPITLAISLDPKDNQAFPCLPPGSNIVYGRS